MAVSSFVRVVLCGFAATLQTREHLVRETLALRHNLPGLKRTTKAPTLPNSDRLVRAFLSKMWSRWTKGVVIVQPQTVVRRHQAGFRLCWPWKSRRRTSRSPTDGAIGEGGDLIGERDRLCDNRG